MMSKQTKKYRKDQRFFVEKEKIGKYLTCPICQEIFDEPTRISCGHTFCNNCINQWEKKSKNDKCPLCREHYIKRYSGKDLIALSMINDAIVTCIYKGCPWKEKLSDLHHHIQTCLFEPGKLPKFMKEASFFHEEKSQKKTKKEMKLNEDEEEEDVGENICSFNYTSTIKERLFSRNPNLVEKLFGEEKKEKKEDEKKNQIKEKISDNDEVNELYNCLSFNNKLGNNNFKINVIDGNEKDNNGAKNNENMNENGQNLQGSSIMNIFISPNITITSPNSFLCKKTDRDEKNNS